MYDGTSLFDCLEEIERTAKIAGGLAELWNFGNDHSDDAKTLDAIEVMCKRLEFLTGSTRRVIDEERKTL